MAFKSVWRITSDKFLSLDQIERLKDKLLDGRDLALARNGNCQAIRDYYGIRTLLESGLRVFEFCSLLNSDFNGLKLLVRKGKGNKPRTVLLTRGTANLFKEWLEVKASLGHSLDPNQSLFPSRYGSAYTTRGVQKRVKLIFAALNFPQHLSVHSLRHTYCSLLLASGKVGIATVKENLGHHSIAVTNLYAHAVGDLSSVDLYSASTSHNCENSELQTSTGVKKLNHSATSSLRNLNLKTHVRKRSRIKAGVNRN